MTHTEDAMLQKKAGDRAHSGVERKPGKRLKRKSSVSREANKIIGIDPEYTLKVASKPGGAVGTYTLKDGSGTTFAVRRLSDYDYKLYDTAVTKLATAELDGRRPGEQKEFQRFEDITKDLKDKDEKWVDKKAPLSKTDYKKEHLISKVFEYTLPEEVFPDKKV